MNEIKALIEALDSDLSKHIDNIEYHINTEMVEDDDRDKADDLIDLMEQMRGIINADDDGLSREQWEHEQLTRNEDI